MPAAAPTEFPVDRLLRRLHSRFIGLRDGAVADYIPALAAADPEPFGIAVATVDGRVYAVGDAERPFTIQSVSKPFTYALALGDRGLAHVSARIGVEPSGDAFNEVSLDRRGRPRNPMINAGAIMASSLVTGDDPLGRLVDLYGACAGRPLRVDPDVYEGERETGHRNRAIAHMLRAVGTLEGSVDRALDTYFAQCSVEVTTRDLALMAATLAARGVQPVTGERVLDARVVEHVLSLMTTCGMYDAAGEWLVDVGIPAKSGVGGGVLGVLPGQLGIAVFSPRLDEVGNSVRGVATFRQLSADLRLHVLNSGRTNRASVRSVRRVADVPSTRFRDGAARAALTSDADAAWVVDTAGDLLFAGAEAISRTVLEASARWVAVDVSPTTVDAAAASVLAVLARHLHRAGGALVLAGAAPVTATAVGVRTFRDVDEATEWCEEQVLARAGVRPRPAGVELTDHRLARAAAAAGAAEEFAALVAHRRHRAGEELFAEGGAASEVYALLEGEVVVTTGGGARRLATLTAGDVFGEGALTGSSRRTADVTARTDVLVAVLSREAVETASAPLRAALLGDLLTIAHDALGRATRTVAALVR
ncbi:glutaminase A [Jatrophihabitans sp. YIM 134969]